MNLDELGYWRAMLRQELFAEVRQLYEQRRTRGLTYRQLAERIGASEAKVKRNLNGEDDIDLNFFCDLARGMGGRIEINVVDLLETKHEQVKP